MTVSNSKTDIVNLALDLIKTENINNVEVPGNDKAAVVANRWYDDLRRDALEGFPWVFATTRSTAPLNATAPAFGFDDAYVLPNNYLSLNFIKYWWLPLSRWNYVIENGNIYIDNSGATSLQIGYTFDQTQTVKFSSAFKIYLAYGLAEKIVYKLTGNAGLQTRITNAKKTAQLEAKAKNGKVNPPVAYRQSKMLAGRRIFGGSRTSGLYVEQNGRT
ncbi:MAG: hypothetical protein KAU50_04395 [Candidatus Marinimicrobia bacterium]|nr:hypothetical protein [Candidatus Neomarinimicrobiota bacterium]